jgi:hypothetical protein
MSKLESDLRSAIEQLRQPKGMNAFDPAAYIRSFESSAQDKAKSVLEMISHQAPFSTLKPVFLSIGGGDGAELEYLLQNSSASVGVLIEGLRPLAEMARTRAKNLSQGKSIEVIEGDAQDKIREAVALAMALISGGRGNYLCVTCHAVLHELFDRGTTKFDPLGFFGIIFEDNTISTWLTYREPGVPEKWPEVVLLGAHCEPHTLLVLAQAICERHASMARLLPQPQVIGDHVRLNRTLAMEVLAKLFYLQDLPHEIEERSTAVDHAQLTNMLWYAIGDRAREASRANIFSLSQPTNSFLNLWQNLGITVKTINQDGLSSQLPVAESQTRIVAWRLADTDSVVARTGEPSAETQAASSVENELSIGFDCLKNDEEELLCALLAAKARAWIESGRAPDAVVLLETIESQVPHDHCAYLWAHYALCLAKLFSGKPISPECFSTELDAPASRIGLGLLFKAERMEFYRKAGELDAALEIANSLVPSLGLQPRVFSSDVERYVMGTASFLMGNILRQGGLYTRAWDSIDWSQSVFRPGSAAQATELAHCYYAKAVCVAMTGISQFDTPFDAGQHPGSLRFANALITLSYSHSSWFVGNVVRAKQFAQQAGIQFADLGYPKYASRARDLSSLLALWQVLESGQRPAMELENPLLQRMVQALIGIDRDPTWVRVAFSRLRPSVAIGLLQFWRRYGRKEDDLTVQLPPVLETGADRTLRWKRVDTYVSLGEADQILRTACSIPLDLRVPIIGD